MKILYVITSTHVGGAEKSLVSLVKSLSPHHTVRVVSLKKCGPVAADLKALGASVTSLEMAGSGLGCVFKLKHEIETFNPDIVHAMLFRAIEFARLACAGRNVKLVTTPHFDLSQKPRWMRWLDRVLKSLDSISTAESVSTFNYLRDVQHYPPLKTVLITNSVEKSLFFKDNSIRSQMRQKNGFSDKDVIFISVARLAPVKNSVVVLQAFAKMAFHCPNAKLVFVGEGELHSDLENLIKVNFLEGKVLLAGEQKNINEWLNMADVFVLLSKEECLPLALLEAQQVGLPCIVSKVGDMPKRVIHGKNGFVCNPQDEMLLSCLLTELYENKQLRARMGAESLAQVGGKKDGAKQYEELYKRLLNL